MQAKEQRFYESGTAAVVPDADPPVIRDDKGGTAADPAVIVFVIVIIVRVGYSGQAVNRSELRIELDQAALIKNLN